MSKLILALVGIISCLEAFSQSAGEPSSANTQPTRHYFFTHLTTTLGLVSYQVNTTLQDEDGFIWVGTNDGLQRFDGVRYKTFRHSDNDGSSLPSNLIWQLLIDKEKNLWVLTVDGKAGIFNTKTFTFSPVTITVNNESFFISNAPLKSLVTDEYGNIYLLVPGSELVTYNKRTRTFSSANNFRGLQQNLKVRGLAQQPGTHKYWMCTDEFGIAVYNSASGKFSYAGNNIENEKAIEQLKDTGRFNNLHFDKSGRLWIVNTKAEDPSISCYDMSKQQMVLNRYYFDKQSLGFHQVRSFFEQRNGTIWVIGQKVFAKYIEKDKVFEQVYNGYEEEYGINYLTITCLLEDRERSMWASTANNGIFRYNPTKDFFSNIRYLSHTTHSNGGGAPVSFMPDKDSSLLVGIREDGLYRFNKNWQQVPLSIKGIPDENNTVIWSMCASANKGITWMATLHGLYKYDQDKRTVTFIEPASLQNKTVRQVFEDRNGNLWLGTQEAGVYKWNAKKGEKKFEDGLSALKDIPPARINRIIQDHKGFVWIATNGSGLYMVDPATDSVHKHFYSSGSGALKLPEQSAFSVLEYNDSLMIIGCNTRLVVYNRLLQTTKTFGGQLSGFIASMEKDDNGHLWVSTTTSLYRVTLKNRVFLLLNRNDGLENDYFLLSASYKLADKRMLFGVFGVMVVFDPVAVSTSPMIPDLKITGFTVKDKSLLVDSLLKQKVIVLSPDENSIVIDLSVLSYNSGYLLRYKLEGLDKDWKFAGQNYQLVYSYLPPGRYTLHVETIDGEGVSGERKLQQAIRINSPFWKTWWFFSALLLLFVLFLFWFDRQRTKRRDTIQKMRSNIAGNLHREVNMALNNINILSEMAKLKADNNPEKSKEFIAQINIKSEQMITALDDMLWSIDPLNDSMPKIIERLMEFIDTLNNGQDANIEMLVDANVQKLRLDMQLRHETLLLFKDLIQTQVQCGARNIIMHINYEKSNLVYSSQFNPDGCDVKQLKIFLNAKDMEKRLRVIHAKLSMDINKSDMLVSLKLPVL